MATTAATAWRLQSKRLVHLHRHDRGQAWRGCFTPCSNLRSYSAKGPAPSAVEPRGILSHPTWSVESLLPDSKVAEWEPSLAPSQLHHLLRLSALPSPTSPTEQLEKLEILRSQLHFVRDVQGVDTSGIEPLRSLRDETEEGMRELAIGVKQLEIALSAEETFGHSRRPRRRKGMENVSSVEDWDVLGTASRKSGRYFVVNSGAK